MNTIADTVSFAFAGPEDEAGLRRLLRTTPMPGAVGIAFAHEPDYFSATSLAGASDRTLIARDDSRIVAAGRCVTALRTLNGEARPCAYLGELRLAASVRGRGDLVRSGYEFFGTEYAREPADYCFTSIVGDNARARRFLERGLRGMPRYTPLADYTALALATPGRRSSTRWWERSEREIAGLGLRLFSGAEVAIETLAACLNRAAAQHQLAATWSAAQLESLQHHGLRPEDFLDRPQTQGGEDGTDFKVPHLQALQAA